jgi:hypothetical protein
MTASEITEIYSDIISLWGEETGNNVIVAIHEAPKYRGDNKLSWDEFLDYCTACGGDWVGMICSGLMKIAPAVWEALPQYLGNPFKAFSTLTNIVYLLGVTVPD